MQRHLTLFLLKFTKSSEDSGLYCTWTDLQIHRQTLVHAGEGESAPLKVFFFPETKDEIRGLTIWLPNLEDNIQLSGLLYGSCDLPGHVDIPRLALKRTHVHTHSLE
ncbi:hypothetical protein XENORESO_020610 [Xenotaenia resolanae]|uniref:Uncharacterized protein n=1 Tax=Xenotaenia resolanae TaxID=208358 RepID=A0ABV0X7J8_9TELE